MRLVFLSNLYQGICTKKFCNEVIGIPLLLFVSQIDQIVGVVSLTEEQYFGFPCIIFEKILNGDTLSFIIPIICTLPYASGFVDEIRCGIVKALLPRSGRKRYLWGKILACAVSGGLALFLGILLTGILSVGLLSFGEQYPVEGETILPFILNVLPRIFLLCLSGALWASVGMLISCVVNSRYVAYLSPFICYYLLIILHERYFSNLIILSPKNWMDISFDAPFGVCGMALWVGELLLMVMLLFVLVAERRLERV